LKRFFRVFLGVLLLLFFTYILLNFGLAGIFTFFLTHPGCAHPTPLAEFPLYQEIWLLTSDEHQLKYWYYPPRNGSVIISLGGNGGSLGDTLPKVDFLLEQGYGVLQIDSRACAIPPAPVTLGAKELLDAEAGLAFLQNQSEVKAIGTFGFSMGGVTAIRLAARHPEVAALVAEGGYYNLGNDFIEPEVRLPSPHRLLLYTIAAGYWLQTGVSPWQVSPIDDLPQISPQPVLLIFGEHEIEGAHAYQQFEAAREPKSLWIVPDGDHGANHLVAPDEYQEKILRFFEQHLNP